MKHDINQELMSGKAASNQLQYNLQKAQIFYLLACYSLSIFDNINICTSGECFIKIYNNVFIYNHFALEPTALMLSDYKSDIALICVL